MNLSKNEEYLIFVVILILIVVLLLHYNNNKYLTVTQPVTGVPPQPITGVPAKRFNIQTDGVTDNSFEQIRQIYSKFWNNEYKIKKFINLWYYTSDINNPIINGRMYYEFEGIHKFKGQYTGYWNRSFYYDTSNGMYSLINNEGREATETNNELQENEIKLLTLYYPLTATQSVTGILAKRFNIQTDDVTANSLNTYGNFIQSFGTMNKNIQSFGTINNK